LSPAEELSLCHFPAVRTVLLMVLFARLAAAKPLTGDVQVWQDAKLYLAPSEQADSFTLSSLDKPRDERTGMTFQMHVVGEQGDFVELAKLSLQEYGAKCHFWGELTIDGRLEGMHVFVRRSDLAPVLAKPWAKSFKDGTSISLLPGEPIGPGKVLALSAGAGVAPARFVADVPTDAIASSFAPPPRGSSTEGVPWEITTQTVAVGGQSLAFDHGLPRIAKPTYRGDRAFVQFDVGCAQLVASVPRTRVRKYEGEAGMFGGLTGGGELPPELTMLVPRGTPLATPSGQRVAVARMDIAVAPTKTAQACADFKLAIERPAEPKPTPGKLVLCAAARALVPRPAPAPARPPRVSFEHGHATTSGGLDEAAIRRVVRRSDDALLACFTAARAKAPDLRGTLTVTFTIGEDGHVGQVTTTGVDAAAPCVTDVFRKAGFPKPSGLVQVEYPLYVR
jgi:hypothetical protein